MGIFLAQRWRQQPQGAVQVDWSNPLTTGVIAVYSGACGRFVHSRYSTRYADPVGAPQAGMYGIGPRLSSDPSKGGAAYAKIPTLDKLKPFTIALAVQWVKTPGYSYFSGLVDPDSGGNRLPTLMTAGAVGTEIAVQYNDGSTKEMSSGLAAAGGDAFLVVMVWDPANNELRLSALKNGRQRADVATSITAASFLTATPSVAHFGVGKGANHTPDDPHSEPIALYAERAWAKRDVDGFFENPWQLFRPLRPIIYSLPTTGPLAPTLSLPGVIDITSSSARPRVTITH